MKPGFRIKEMFAFVTLDPADDCDGIIGWNGMPLVGADMDRVNSLREVAQQVSNVTGQKIRIIKFSQMTEIGKIEPDDNGAH